MSTKMASFSGLKFREKCIAMEDCDADCQIWRSRTESSTFCERKMNEFSDIKEFCLLLLGFVDKTDCKLKRIMSSPKTDNTPSEHLWDAALKPWWMKAMSSLPTLFLSDVGFLQGEFEISESSDNSKTTNERKLCGLDWNLTRFHRQTFGTIFAHFIWNFIPSSSPFSLYPDLQLKQYFFWWTTLPMQTCKENKK